MQRLEDYFNEHGIDAPIPEELFELSESARKRIFLHARDSKTKTDYESYMKAALVYADRMWSAFHQIEEEMDAE